MTLVVGIVAVAAAATLGDFIWYTVGVRHTMVAGLVHGALLLTSVGGATVVVPPTRTANVSRYGLRSGARDRTILAVKERGRRRWKKTSGYHGQARVENAFFRYTSIIGDSLRACRPAGRGTEVVLACNLLNQMTGLGRPMSYRIGR